MANTLCDLGSYECSSLVLSKKARTAERAEPLGNSRANRCCQYCCRADADPLQAATARARTTAPRASRDIVTSNGEVEGPHISAGPWRRGRTMSQRLRRLTDHASRPPPTIVRWHVTPWCQP